MKILFQNAYLNFPSLFGEKVNAIINEYPGKEALEIKFISESEDKLSIFANVFKESPFSFNYPIRSIGYCERLIAEYNLTTEEQIACIFHEIGHVVIWHSRAIGEPVPLGIDAEVFCDTIAVKAGFALPLATALIKMRDAICNISGEDAEAGAKRKSFDDRIGNLAYSLHLYRPEWTCGRYNANRHCALMYNLIRGVVNYFDELSADVIDYILSVPRNGELSIDAIIKKTNLPVDIILNFIDQLRNVGLVTLHIPDKEEIRNCRIRAGEWRRWQQFADNRSTQEKLPYDISNAEMQYNEAVEGDSKVTSVMFELTYNCSEKCIHCYNPGATRNDSEKSGRNREELTLNEYKRVIDELCELGLYKVCLSGGDPFSKPIIWDIIDYLWQKEIAFDIFTNGQRVFNDVERLLSYYPRLIGVSIYSQIEEAHDKITRVPGSLRKSIKFVEKLSEYGMAMNLKCVIMQPNLKTYRSVKELATKYGAVPQFEVCVSPSNEGDMCAPRNLRLTEDQLYVVLRDDNIPLYVGPEAPNFGGQSRLMTVNACGAGDSTFCITPEGNVQVCCSFPASLGNVKEQSVSEILSGEQLRKWQKTTLESYVDCGRHDYCGYCNLCPGNNYVENGTPLKAAESNCFIAKTRYNLAQKMKGGYDPLNGRSLDDAIAGLEVDVEPLAKEETRNFRNIKFEVE